MTKNSKIISALELFLQSEKTHPNRPALEKGKEVVSYSVLRQLAGRMASLIIANAGKESYVAVAADRSIFSYAAIIGIMMAGKGYVPLNPKYPGARNRDILVRSGVRTILSANPSITSLAGESHVITPDDITEDVGVAEVQLPGPASPAYLLFTSGSTGQPKGVPVSHGNLSSYLLYMLSNYDLKPDDRFSQVFELTFDLSVHDIFLALASGGCLVIPEDENPLSFYHYIRKKEITAWFSVPTVARMMNRMRLLKEDSFPTLRYCFFCGEPLGVRETEAWQAAASRSEVINLYGPTEATIAISEYTWDKRTEFRSCNGVVSIGKVFAGQGYRIAFEDDREDKGELWLSGSQVVEGYHEDPSNTEKSFTRMEDGSFWYRTGDLVSRDDEGYLYFLGRADQEVKVHGYRVNLLGVEEVLINASGAHAAVIYRRDKETDRLIAFVEKSSKMNETGLLEHCRLTLPWYMVPEKIIFVDSMPLNPNGKTDRNKLKEMTDHEQ